MTTEEHQEYCPRDFKGKRLQEGDLIIYPQIKGGSIYLRWGLIVRLPESRDKKIKVVPIELCYTKFDNYEGGYVCGSYYTYLTYPTNLVVITQRSDVPPGIEEAIEVYNRNHPTI